MGARFVVLVGLSGVLSLPPGAALAWDVGVAPATRKILPRTPVPQGSRAVGFLYWRVSYWVDDDPFNVLLNLPYFGEFFARNGDGFLLYPGDHDGTAAPKGSPEGISIDGPIASYRLKQIRDGLEDWEMFKLASELGGEDYVRAQVGRAYTRFGNFFIENCDDPVMYCPDDQPWTLDEQVLFDVRENVARKLLHLLHPDRYPDPEALPEEEEEDGGCSGCRSLPAASGWILLALAGFRSRHW